MSNPINTKIATLNDQFRTSLGLVDIPNCRAVITRSISMLPTKDHNSILSAIRSFDAFTAEDDPYGQRDFGAITTSWGVDVFWKIDYYDLKMSGGSPDPSDAAATIRVLTVMLAEEY